MKSLQAGEKAGAVREARRKTVERIIELANARQVDFVLVAGDQFEERTPRTAEIGEVVGALRRATMPVYVLPGNHDPAGLDGPYTGEAWKTLAGTRVVTILEPRAYEVPGGVLLASPCTKKYSTGDPTAWFADSDSPPDAIRVGLAHGELQIPGTTETSEGEQRGSFPIPLDAASRGRLDYLALGHWHSFLRQDEGGATIAYSGTPEQTCFTDRDCGTVSIVTIDGPGARPSIERVRTGSLRWIDTSHEISDEASIDRLAEALRTLEAPERILARVHVKGLCTPAATERLGVLEAELAARFFFIEFERAIEARPQTRDAWLAVFPPGDFQEIAGKLLDQIDRSEEPATAARALELLAEYAR
jgi:DNA repair exonuclease SbcCD nuclease subunit